MASSDIPLLEVRRISKSFPGVRALDGVNLRLQQGEVLSVIGENGAGKSTLMKILAGIQSPDHGEVLLEGKSTRIDSVRAAAHSHIALIHQELNLADNLSIGANMYLGREPNRLGFVRRQKISRDAANFLARVGLELPPEALVSGLTIGQQQLVEIAKALSANARILIMDEPTSSLSRYETESLFQAIAELRKQDVSIVYISHRLSEVKSLSDRVMVLRDGKNAGELDRDEIAHDAMVQLMVGRDISQFYARRNHPIGDTVLQIDRIRTPENPRHEVSFTVKRGEIVGLAGLVGAGRSELFNVLFGAHAAVNGRVLVEGKEALIRRPVDAIRYGLALVPEDRKSQGLILAMSVENNIGLAGLRANRGLAGFLNVTRERTDTLEMTKSLNIRTTSAQQIVRYLSGGNQQKVVLAKWLSLGPKVLLLDEPTRGIDIGAKQEIYRLMETLAENGVAVVFASGEMEEILGMSDRVLVMHEGQLMGQLSRDSLSEESIMQFATGNLRTNQIDTT